MVQGCDKGLIQCNRVWTLLFRKAIISGHAGKGDKVRRQRVILVLVVASLLIGGCRGNTPAAIVTAVPTIAAVLTTMPAVTKTCTPTKTTTCAITATATPLPALTITALPTEPGLTPIPTQPALATLTPVAENPQAVSVEYGTIVLQAYDLSEALYYSPELTYPHLDWGLVGGIVSRTCDTVILRNAYLELTLIPELGGRIYRCVFLPTGQELFYQTPVLKPTHWGPEEQGWWLAIGGLEFCLPVEEHGYLTAEPWDCTVWTNADGSVTARMQCLDTMRNLSARADITLPVDSAGFDLAMAITNVGDEIAACQYWVNGMMAPAGDSVSDRLVVYCPAERVIVHSRGDNQLPAAGEWMSWPNYAGTDWSLYSNWQNWLGFFAPELSASASGVYEPETRIGMVRTFDASVQGTKMFGFGSDFGDTGQYTADGSKYFEMWGGLTTAFDTERYLEPGASAGWQETWWVVSGLEELTTVSDDLAVSAIREGSRLDLGIVSRIPCSGNVRILVGDSLLLVQEVNVSPSAAFEDQFDLGSVGTGDTVQVEITLNDQALELVVW